MLYPIELRAPGAILAERARLSILRLRTLAERWRRYGYRRLTVLLRREGRAVNPKRVYRLYRDAGLAVRRRRRKRAARLAGRGDDGRGPGERAVVGGTRRRRCTPSGSGGSGRLRFPAPPLACRRQSALDLRGTDSHNPWTKKMGAGHRRVACGDLSALTGHGVGMFSPRYHMVPPKGDHAAVQPIVNRSGRETTCVHSV